jgi:multiple sugar transport system substrate-binding protein
MRNPARLAALAVGLALSATAIWGPLAVAQEEQELTFSLWAYQDDIATAYDEFIAAFEEAHPGTTITVEAQPFARYHDVINVKLAGGDPPDVAHIAFNLAPAYIDAGALVDLKPYLENLEGYDFAGLRPSSLEPWTRDGAVYGIPFTNSTNVMYYNKDIFEAAGIPTPDEMAANGEWTWENMAAAAKTIVESGAGRYGMLFGNQIFTNGWRILEDIWAPYGGAPWSEDGKTCRFNAPETVEATQLVWDMIYTDKSHPEPGVDADFFSGDIGMGLYRPSAAPRLVDPEPVPFEWGIAPQPSGPLGYVPAAATNGITVFAGSENPELAAEFLAFTTNLENARRMSRNFPAARESLQTLEVLSEANPVISPEDIETTILAAITHPDASWGYTHPFWGPLQTEAQRVFDGDVWKPDADVPAALDKVCTEIEALLG